MSEFDDINAELNDILVFDYTDGANLKEFFSETEYNNCQSSRGLIVQGDGPAFVELDTPGVRYFASTKGDDCQSGRKVKVIVDREIVIENDDFEIENEDKIPENNDQIPEELDGTTCRREDGGPGRKGKDYEIKLLSLTIDKCKESCKSSDPVCFGYQFEQTFSLGLFSWGCCQNWLTKPTSGKGEKGTSCIIY